MSLRMQIGVQSVLLALIIFGVTNIASALECGLPNAFYWWSKPAVNSSSNICMLVRYNGSNTLHYLQSSSTTCDKAKKEFCISQKTSQSYVHCCNTENCLDYFTDTSIMDRCLKCNSGDDTTLITVNGICLLKRKLGETAITQHATSLPNAADCELASLKSLCDQKHSKEKLDALYCCQNFSCLSDASEKDLLKCSYLNNIKPTDIFCKTKLGVKPDWMISKDSGVCVETSMMDNSVTHHVNRKVHKCDDLKLHVNELCTYHVEKLFCCRKRGCLEDATRWFGGYVHCPLFCSKDLKTGPLIDTSRGEGCMIYINIISGSDTVRKYVKSTSGQCSNDALKRFCSSMKNSSTVSVYCCVTKKCAQRDGYGYFTPCKSILMT